MKIYRGQTPQNVKFKIFLSNFSKSSILQGSIFKTSIFTGIGRCRCYSVYDNQYVTRTFISIMSMNISTNNFSVEFVRFKSMKKAGMFHPIASNEFSCYHFNEPNHSNDTHASFFNMKIVNRIQLHPLTKNIIV